MDMKLITEIFRHPNVNPQGKTIHREAVRGIIRDGERLLMVYSTQNGDYKFPGGGVGAGESQQQALIREIREECGALVTEVGPEFGKAIEYDFPLEPEYDVFKMTSFYFCCQVAGTLTEQRLDDYEREMGFQPAWVAIAEAIRVNREILATKDYSEFPWIARDTFVLEQLPVTFET
jgi:8-oxo-dGTP pyrophosphatase MutT (NUDIX family)